MIFAQSIESTVQHCLYESRSFHFEQETGVSKDYHILFLGTRLNTRCGDVSYVRNVNVDR